MVSTAFNRAGIRTVLATALCAAALTTFTPAVGTATPAATGTAAAEATGLVGDVTRAQSEMDRLALEIGGLHEEVNKALVDLHDAQGTAEQARQAVLAARAELDETQGKIEEAQQRLDEISRAAYRRTTTPPAVATLAGEDASNDSLDRQTYLRTNAEKQRAAIDELDQLRTEQANRESQLRLARDSPSSARPGRSPGRRTHGRPSNGTTVRSASSRRSATASPPSGMPRRASWTRRATRSPRATPSSRMRRSTGRLSPPARPPKTWRQQTPRLPTTPAA